MFQFRTLSLLAAGSLVLGGCKKADSPPSANAVLPEANMAKFESMFFSMDRDDGDSFVRQGDEGNAAFRNKCKEQLQAAFGELNQSKEDHKRSALLSLFTDLAEDLIAGRSLDLDTGIAEYIEHWQQTKATQKIELLNRMPARFEAISQAIANSGAKFERCLLHFEANAPTLVLIANEHFVKPDKQPSEIRSQDILRKTLEGFASLSMNTIYAEGLPCNLVLNPEIAKVNRGRAVVDFWEGHQKVKVTGIENGTLLDICAKEDNGLGFLPYSENLRGRAALISRDTRPIDWLRNSFAADVILSAEKQTGSAAANSFSAVIMGYDHEFAGRKESPSDVLLPLSTALACNGFNVIVISTISD